MTLTIDGVTIEIRTDEEFYIVGEVYLKACYDYVPTRPTVIVDIGMNVGMASLRFASSPNVVAVYGFEPFPQTYSDARKNFDANPELSRKIVAENVGLAGEDQDAEFHYDPAHKGKSSVKGMNQDVIAPGASAKVRVRLRATGPVLADIIARHPVADRVVKIDCEGAEYEILPAMAAAGVLDKIHVIMMEWHIQGPAPLLDILHTSGFRVVSTIGYKGRNGMIYAMR
ncbi:MAG: FkbM family methyltransferase [Fimbriiglobus sp.]